jgi:hypothetical protein
VYVRCVATGKLVVDSCSVGEERSLPDYIIEYNKTASDGCGWEPKDDREIQKLANLVSARNLSVEQIYLGKASLKLVFNLVFSIACMLITTVQQKR